MVLQLSKSLNPEDAGKQVRTLLGVSLEEQFEWKGPYDAFNGWRDAIEDSGILVTQMEEVAPGEAVVYRLLNVPCRWWGF